MTERERLDQYQEGPRIFRHRLTRGEWELLQTIRQMGAELVAELAASGAYLDYRKRQSGKRMKAA